MVAAVGGKGFDPSIAILHAGKTWPVPSSKLTSFLVEKSAFSESIGKIPNHHLMIIDHVIIEWGDAGKRFVTLFAKEHSAGCIDFRCWHQTRIYVGFPETFRHKTDCTSGTTHPSWINQVSVSFWNQYNPTWDTESSGPVWGAAARARRRGTSDDTLGNRRAPARWPGLPPGATLHLSAYSAAQAPFSLTGGSGLRSTCSCRECLTVGQFIGDGRVKVSRLHTIESIKKNRTRNY